MTRAATTRRNAPTAAELRELRLDIEDFNIEYARVLDARDLEAWPGFFTEDAVYRITARENADANLPIGLVYCQGRGMFNDRVRATLKTTMHAPRYLRHYNSNVRVLGIADDGAIASESNYLVVETLMEDETRIFQAGQYRDRFVREGDALKLKARECVYDSLLIPVALVYPV